MYISSDAVWNLFIIHFLCLSPFIFFCLCLDSVLNGGYCNSWHLLFCFGPVCARSLQVGRFHEEWSETCPPLTSVRGWTTRLGVNCQASQ